MLITFFLQRDSFDNYDFFRWRSYYEYFKYATQLDFLIYFSNLRKIMNDKFTKIISNLFVLVFLISSTMFIIHTEKLYASESSNSDLIKKVSRSYTKKFCNAVGFGLSKESAMSFSINENNQVFKKRKEFNNINKDLLSEKIALEVVEKCGYPINLKGEKGIQEFKNFYLSTDIELSGKN